MYPDFDLESTELKHFGFLVEVSYQIFYENLTFLIIQFQKPLISSFLPSDAIRISNLDQEKNPSTLIEL